MERTTAYAHFDRALQRCGRAREAFRTAFVAFLGLIAIVFSEAFALFLALTGSFACAGLAFVLPSTMYLGLLRGAEQAPAAVFAASGALDASAQLFGRQTAFLIAGFGTAAGGLSFVLTIAALFSGEGAQQHH